MHLSVFQNRPMDSGQQESTTVPGNASVSEVTKHHESRTWPTLTVRHAEPHGLQMPCGLLWHGQSAEWLRASLAFNGCEAGLRECPVLAPHIQPDDPVCERDKVSAKTKLLSQAGRCIFAWS